MPSTPPALILSFLLLIAASRAEESTGIFQDHADIGAVRHSGSATFDPEKRTYTLRGSGENMWSTADAFHLAWKKVSGDLELTAGITFLNSAGNQHKKAVLILRQSLDADSVYADVALHGNGLVSLQYRDEKGAATHEVQSPVSAPARLRITRRGNYVYLSLAAAGDDPHFAGASIRIPLEGEFYAGIGVCSHGKDAVEQATFSNLDLRPLSASSQPALYSTLETVAIGSTDRRIVYLAPGRFEAPNWSRDGSYFLFNRDGHLEKLPMTGGAPSLLATGFADRCNNDHGFSPDSTLIAISDQSQESHDSLVYVLPAAGGTPRRISKNSPSYWHGWSPDGKTLAFVGQRNGDFDIYTIPLAGGEETRLTTAPGLDDGPEYSPDGQYIYFNSERTGHMQIWRMHPDGTQQEQVFFDDSNNWFPHISPDGKWMVFLTYDKNVTGHPENKDVMLRLMSLADRKTDDKKIDDRIDDKKLDDRKISEKIDDKEIGKKIDGKKIIVLAKLFGGQGTINVPSWSPDSSQLAFVSYQLIEP